MILCVCTYIFISERCPRVEKNVFNTYRVVVTNENGIKRDQLKKKKTIKRTNSVFKKKFFFVIKLKKRFMIATNHRNTRVHCVYVLAQYK